MATQNDRRIRSRPQNVRLPLIGSMTNRSYVSTKDQRFVNIFPETRKVEQIESTKIFLNKRPGLTVYKDYGTGEGRGVIYFNSKLYIAVGNTVYEDGVTPTAKITLSGLTGPLGMLVGNSSNSGDYLFVCDGTAGWTINTSGTVTQITGDSVLSVDVTDGGSGYKCNPLVTFSSGTATATSTIVGNSVATVTVTSGGSGYSSAPTVSFSLPVLTFNPTTVLNVTTNEITVTHTGITGAAVIYNNGGGGSIGGLTSGSTYYLIKVSDSIFKLATSLVNAEAGTAIDLTSVGSGTSHTLTFTEGSGAVATALLNAFPSPHVPTPVFIDGYILLPQNSDIYNCVLDEPTKWESSNYISSEVFPDPIKALARQNNQVASFGATSVEFFYDAANPSASPLSRNEGTAIQLGTAAAYCIYQSEKNMMFIGQSDSGGRAVWIVEGFQPKRVSDEFVDRILDSEIDMSDVRGYGIRSLGHLFYVINLPTANRTLVYDTDEKLWHEWSNNNNGSHEVFSCNYMTDTQQGFAYMLHKSNGTVYKFDTEKYQDDSTAIITEIVTNKYDMDTLNRKFQSNLRILGDWYSTNTNIDVRWTDDDYKTWSNWKTIDLTDNYPNFARMGAFRRRAYNLKHTENTALRLEALEVTYKEGDH